jgi:fructoselysine-6-P-deglycase FrlB-like protein
MSIRAMEKEILSQAEDLPSFASELRKKQLPRTKPSSFVFTGSGDSYATAVFAQELSRGEAFASDPYELLMNIRKTKGKKLAIVSVSGKTKTNVKLARKAKRIATKIIAITANPESPLAKEADETLQLNYRATGILTSGTVSFTTSMLACTALLGNLPRNVELGTALTDNTLLGENRESITKGSFVLTGSGVNYSLSLYGAAKINEVLGARAEAVCPEELGHAKLFPIAKKQDLIVCVSSGQDKAMETHKLLRQGGLASMVLSVPSGHLVNRSLGIAIRLQRFALSLARKNGLKECAFLRDKGRLLLSNRMIY